MRNSLLVRLTTVAAFIAVFLFSANATDTDNAFPRLLSVTTTRDVATQHSAHWDIRHKGSKRLRHIDEEMVQLRVILHSEETLSQLQQLQSEGILTYEDAVDENDDQDSQRLLQSINYDEMWCYRTVVETLATLDQLQDQYPNLVTVTTIGESYRKQQNSNEGHDINVIVIGNKDSSIVGDKSDMMIVAGHHPRELPPPETVLRWAEHLLAQYGTDPDITWVLDRTNIHIVPMANPDGREIVQDHLEWWYRKNAHTNGCSERLYGVDLNRNYPMFWGDNSGSSRDECDTNYGGTGPLSEPETAAVFNYQAALFDDSIKKGTAEQAEDRDDEACPTSASGIFIDVHSNGDFIYFPWGYRDEHSPNHLALLTMSAKLASPGDYELWGPDQDGFLYYVSGDATDATYGVGCVFSVGYEIGSEMYASCKEMESEIVPIMEESLLYAAKCASAPYLLPLGPDILSIDVDSSDSANVQMTVKVSDEELIVSHANFDDDAAQPIAAVHVSVDIHPYDDSSQRILMEPMDGAFDNVDETAGLALDLSTLDGHHVLYFQATDEDGYAGPVSAVFVELEAKETTASPTQGPTPRPTSQPSNAPEPDRSPVTIESAISATNSVYVNATEWNATETNATLDSEFTLLGNESVIEVDSVVEEAGSASQSEFSVSISKAEEATSTSRTDSPENEKPQVIDPENSSTEGSSATSRTGSLTAASIATIVASLGFLLW